MNRKAKTRIKTNYSFQRAKLYISIIKKLLRTLITNIYLDFTFESRIT